MFCAVPSVGVSVCVHVSSYEFLISQCLILLIFKRSSDSKVAFDIEISPNQMAVAVAISMMLIIVYSDYVSSVLYPVDVSCSTNLCSISTSRSWTHEETVFRQALKR